MKRLVTDSQMKLLDQTTSTKYGVLPVVLMEQAAMGFVLELLSLKQKFSNVLVVCGGGNNGADGIAIARLLNQKGIRTTIHCLENEKVSELFSYQKNIYEEYDYPQTTDMSKDSYDLIIDGIFGVGLSRTITGKYETAIKQMNEMNAYKIAIDISSGVSGENGAIQGIAFRADRTFTFSFGKTGQYLWEGSDYSGKIHVLPIGITLDGFKDTDSLVSVLEDTDLNELIPKRIQHSNKGTYGKCLVIAGSIDMAGAACLSAEAAYRSGAGLVKVFTPEENRLIVQQNVPEAILCTYSSEDILSKLEKEIEWASSIVIGPGMGTEETTEIILKFVLQSAKVPLVIDADGLNVLAKHLDWLDGYSAAVIVTPHLGEMSRLTEKSIFEIQENPVETAKNFAKEWNLVCVLKDACTVIADQVGNTYLNLSGNAGMATAGSGDVLAGIVAAVCCMYLPNKMLNVSDDSVKIPDVNSGFQAAMGVMLHGCSGDKAAEQKGMYSMTARDIIANVGTVLQRKEEKL